MGPVESVTYRKREALIPPVAPQLPRSGTARQLGAVRVKGPGRIIISNDDSSIRVSQRHNNRETELLKLSSRRVSKRATSPVRPSAKLDSRVPAYLGPIIEEAAQRHGIDPRLLSAVARRESRFRPTAVSPVGAQGVMQLMPATAKWLGVADAFDPRQNIFGGAKYLKMMLDQFHGNVELSLAAYNAGPGAVKKYRGIPPYRETQEYVAAIRSDYESSL